MVSDLFDPSLTLPPAFLAEPPRVLGRGVLEFLGQLFDEALVGVGGGWAGFCIRQAQAFGGYPEKYDLGLPMVCRCGSPVAAVTKCDPAESDPMDVTRWVCR